MTITDRDRLSTYVAEILSKAPKLTDEQRQRLTAIMRGAAGGAR